MDVDQETPENQVKTCRSEGLKRQCLDQAFLGAKAQDAETQVVVVNDEDDAAPDSKGIQALLQELKTEVRRSGGGPVQYLEKHCDAAGFRQWLHDCFPLREEIHYSHDEKTLPLVEEKEMSDVLPLTVHVSALGFTRDCSLKPPCGLDLMLTLCDPYLTEGFTTAAEPLMVLQNTTPGISEKLPELENGGLKTFSLGYLKGFARATSLLCLLHFMKKRDVNPEQQFPALWDSVLRIRVHHVKTTSRMNEAWTNMKISAEEARYCWCGRGFGHGCLGRQPCAGASEVGPYL